MTRNAAIPTAGAAPLSFYPLFYPLWFSRSNSAMTRFERLIFRMQSDYLRLQGDTLVLQFADGLLVGSYFFFHHAEGAVLLQQMLIHDAMYELGLTHIQLMLGLNLVHMDIRLARLALEGSREMIECRNHAAADRGHDRELHLIRQFIEIHSDPAHSEMVTRTPAPSSQASG